MVPHRLNIKRECAGRVSFDTRRVDAAANGSLPSPVPFQRRSIFMRPILQRLPLGAAILGAALGQDAFAQDRAVYVTTYVEFMSNAATAGAALLENYRDASRKEDGNLRFDALQEIGRPNRFATMQAWRDRAALDAHAAAATTVQFHDKLKAIETAPEDERINNALNAGRGKSAMAPRTIYVVTHVDVISTGKDDCMAALKAMVIDSANEAGNISYEAFQQANRGNHFTVVEAWSNMTALDAHAKSAYTRQFREKPIPIAGALYDERLYQAPD